MGTEISIDSSSGSGDSKCKRGSHSRGRSKKIKCEWGSGRAGQQLSQPKFAKEDNLGVEIHAGYYPKGVYCSLSKGQQEQVKALRDAKKNKVSYGLKSVVLASVTDIVEPVPDVSTMVQKVVSPDKTSVMANATAGSGDSGAPADDKDSVIAMEDNEPARDGVQKVTLVCTLDTKPQTCSRPSLAIVPFGCVADQKPALENTQVRLLWRLTPSPRQMWKRNPRPNHGDLAKAGTSLRKGANLGPSVPRKRKTRPSSSMRNTLIGSNMNMVERKDTILSSNMACCRAAMDHSAHVGAFPNSCTDLKAARKLMEKQAYEQIRAWGYPKHR
jgi:hypothetical protein